MTILCAKQNIYTLIVHGIVYNDTCGIHYSTKKLKTHIYFIMPIEGCLLHNLLTNNVVKRLITVQPDQSFTYTNTRI